MKIKKSDLEESTKHKKKDPAETLTSKAVYSRRNFLQRMGLGIAVASSASLMVNSNVLAAGAFKTEKPKSGCADIYAFKCGVLKTQTQYMLKDTRVGTPMDIPVTFFLIRHGDKWIAFDTGNNGMVARNPVEYWSKPICDAYYPVMKKEEEFKVQIDKAFGIKPKDMEAVILSHGHLDHAGAIDNFIGTDVPIYLQNKELDQINQELIKSKKTGKYSAYIPGDFKHLKELNIKPIEGVFDLFGDQSVVSFPTPGHTPGHQSLMVKQSNGDIVLLSADADYTLENMEKSIPPGLAWDIPQATEALYMFKVINWMGDHINIVPSHDPDFWAKMSFAPKLYEV